MTIEQLKEMYGEEYPAAVVVDGVRLGLTKERRFSRSYDSPDHKLGSEISRFMDGSARITALELEREWPNWTENERNDFCQSCCWLSSQSDFPNMLRFIMEHSGPKEWSGVALSAAHALPREEAFDILVRALSFTEIGQTANIGQAIAHTKHEQAEKTLRRHFQEIWAHPALWDEADFVNWIAFDAITCIAHLIELGAPAIDFVEQARRLSEHPCSGNRDSCRNFLRKHYFRLEQPKRTNPGG